MRSQFPTLACVERDMHSLIRSDRPKTGLIEDAALHHLAPGGRRVRAQIALAAAQKLSLTPSTSLAIAGCCELLHNASLVHDDLQDRDEERRGRPAVWRAYGDDVAICLGDFFISAAYAALGRADVGARLPELFRATHEAIAETVRGQVADRTTAAGDLRSVDAYDDIAAGKSGPLLALPVVLSLRAAERPDACDTAHRAARSFAIAYQIVDDLEDVASDGETRVNAVAVAMRERDLSEQAARRHCEARAAQLLSEAALLSNRLPAEAGAALEGFAQLLSSQIGARHAA